MATWTRVAHGVHQRRGGPFDLSVVVIEGDDGLLVVDTGAEPAEAEEILADLASRFDRPVRRVVNTHAHFDHTFGNQVFGPGSTTDAAILGHAGIARHFERYEGPRLAAWRADPTREPDRRWADLRLVPPSHPVERMTRLDLGGRDVELLPQAPAHTDTDLVLLVPAQRVWIVGDLVESRVRRCTDRAATRSTGPACSTRWWTRCCRATWSCPATVRWSIAISWLGRRASSG